MTVLARALATVSFVAFVVSVALFVTARSNSDLSIRFGAAALLLAIWALAVLTIGTRSQQAIGHFIAAALSSVAVVCMATLLAAGRLSVAREPVASPDDGLYTVLWITALICTALAGIVVALLLAHRKMEREPVRYILAAILLGPIIAVALAATSLIMWMAAPTVVVIAAWFLTQRPQNDLTAAPKILN